MLVGSSVGPLIRCVRANLGSNTDLLLTTASHSKVNPLNSRDVSVLERISTKLIESDKVALRQELNKLKEEYENSKQSCCAWVNQIKISDYEDKIRTIEHLLDNWENQNEYDAKISQGYRQIVSRLSKTTLSVEELTSFEYDSHILIKRINKMITINSNYPNRDILKKLKDVRQRFLTFLNAIDSNNITDENKKDLLDYQNRIEHDLH